MNLDTDRLSDTELAVLAEVYRRVADEVTHNRALYGWHLDLAGACDRVRFQRYADWHDTLDVLNGLGSASEPTR